MSRHHSHVLSAVETAIVAGLVAGCVNYTPAEGEVAAAGAPAAAPVYASSHGAADRRRSDRERKYAKPGFAVAIRDGRLWVFRDPSPELTEFRKEGPPEKHVTRVGAGPDRLTIKAPDTETIDLYILAQPGFDVFLDKDGRAWVFRAGSAGSREFKRGEIPEKHVTLIGRGPMGKTLKSPDRAVLDAYLEVRSH